MHAAGDELDLIQVDRIDHGVNCLEVPELAEAIAARGLGLTVCLLFGTGCGDHLYKSYSYSLVSSSAKAARTGASGTLRTA